MPILPASVFPILFAKRKDKIFAAASPTTLYQNRLFGGLFIICTWNNDNLEADTALSSSKVLSRAPEHREVCGP